MDIAINIPSPSLTISSPPPPPQLPFIPPESAGVSRLLECCQECGVSSLVFMSSSRVVPSPRDDDKRREEGGRSGSGGGPLDVLRDAEAEVLKARQAARAMIAWRKRRAKRGVFLLRRAFWPGARGIVALNVMWLLCLFDETYGTHP